MGAVRMTHPDLPEQPIEVDEMSVPHHQAAGWQVADDQPQLPPAPAPRRGRTTTRKETG